MIKGVRSPGFNKPQPGSFVTKYRKTSTIMDHTADTKPPQVNTDVANESKSDSMADIEVASSPLEEKSGEVQSFQDYTEDEENKVIRKIDWRILPLLWGYTVLSAVDVGTTIFHI